MNYDQEQTQIFETKYMSSLSIEDDGNYASEEEHNQPANEEEDEGRTLNDIPGDWWSCKLAPQLVGKTNQAQ